MPSNEDASALSGMFEQMTGSKNAEPEIIIPKINKIKDLLSKFIKLYNLLLNFDEFISNFIEYEHCFDDIKIFVGSLQKIIDDINLVSGDKLNKADKDVINDLYKQIKGRNEIQTIIVTSGSLKNYKRYIENKDNLMDEFISREPGLTLTPFSFTKLDLKKLWVSDKLTVMAKKFILNIIHHTYIIGLELYDIITSPDVDIKKFSKVLISSIEKLKKSIPRCDGAFNIIKDSVELLEDNFKGYYKNSVEAGNPSIIIESFIIDVSMKQKSNARITGQFRRIIMYMKKKASNNTDPRVKQLFKVLNSQFDLMSKETGIEPVDGDDDIEEEVEEEVEVEEETTKENEEEILNNLMKNINT